MMASRFHGLWGFDLTLIRADAVLRRVDQLTLVERVALVPVHGEQRRNTQLAYVVYTDQSLVKDYRWCFGRVSANDFVPWGECLGTIEILCMYLVEVPRYIIQVAGIGAR